MATTPHFTAVLRGWREARRMTQFDLAAAADISPRHLSCLETGKAQAGRNVVLRLSAALEMPLRDCNGLLMAAGYAPVYPETALTTPPLAEVRRAIDLLLQKQLPYAAAVLDRDWNILQTNAGFDRIVHHVLGGRPSRHANMVSGRSSIPRTCAPRSSTGRRLPARSSGTFSTSSPSRPTIAPVMR